MPRPDQPPMRRLPTLEPRRTELETCVFCPKLCRGACPIAEADPSEALTPWGKMSLAYFAAHEQIALEDSVARAAWACTGCMGCRQNCDHENDVAGTLLSARTAFVAAGKGPASVRAVGEGFAQMESETHARIGKLQAKWRENGPGNVGLLLGCSYVRDLPEETDAALFVAKGLLEGCRLVSGCCGMPLAAAGELDRFRDHVVDFADRVSGFTKLVVLDPGCALLLKEHAPALGVPVRPEIVTLVELVARNLERLVPQRSAPPFRYHDPCRLGRGLGIYTAPREILARIAGTAPLEFEKHAEESRCSGAGGLLPVTMPEVAHEIARVRLSEVALAEHVITACASSLRSFRKVRKADDIISWTARALSP